MSRHQKGRRSRRGKAVDWMSMVHIPLSDEGVAHFRAMDGDEPDAVWINDLYQVVVLESPDGFTHLSIRRQDRAAARDWRHFQQIKNEVCDPEREAFELYPAESRLVDTSNQYHLWVLPAGDTVPLGPIEREVATPEEAASAGAKQRPWQAGLTTGGSAK